MNKKRSREREYAVIFKNFEGKITKLVFNRLSKARERGNELNRAGSFISLVNINKIPLPL